MTTFKKYPKIHRLGKEENDGILYGKCTIQEKLDGANVSIWLDKRGEVTCGSRTRELSEGFNGFVDFVKQHDGIQKWVKDNPTLRLYGEWLCRHTIAYNETAYKQFYLFDITVVVDGEEVETFMSQEYVRLVSTDIGVPTPTYHGEFENPTMEQIMPFVGISSLGTVGEGVVIKNDDFLNKFGEKVYAKIVTEKFKEDNAIVFGGNNKYSDSYWEIYIINKYMSLARVEKIMHKIQPTIDERLDMEHTPRIANSAYHDMITEEIWEIQKKAQQVNFMKLRKLSMKKAIKIYHDILRNHISVAYENSNNS